MNASFLETLRRDHAHLAAILDSVDELLLRRATGLAAGRAAGTFAGSAHGRALEFAARLGAHLATEAEFEVAIAARSDDDATTRSVLSSVRGEHLELRSMLGALVHTLDAPSGARRDEGAAVQLRDLVDLVRIHLRKEDVLLLAATSAAASPAQRRKGTAS